MFTIGVEHTLYNAIPFSEKHKDQCKIIINELNISLSCFCIRYYLPYGASIRKEEFMGPEKYRTKDLILQSWVKCSMPVTQIKRSDMHLTSLTSLFLSYSHCTNRLGTHVI